MGTKELLSRFGKLNNTLEGSSVDITPGTYLFAPTGVKLVDSKVEGGNGYFKYEGMVAGVVQPIAADTVEVKGEKVFVRASVPEGFVGVVVDVVGNRFPGYAFNTMKEFITAIETRRGLTAEQIQVFLEGDPTAADTRPGLNKYLDEAWFAKNVADPELGLFVMLYNEPTPQSGGRPLVKKDRSLGLNCFTRLHWSVAR